MGHQWRASGLVFQGIDQQHHYTELLAAEHNRSNIPKAMRATYAHISQHFSQPLASAYHVHMAICMLASGCATDEQNQSPFAKLADNRM
jgi:hypothetical protein